MSKTRSSRTGNSFRRLPQEISGDVILIVCEGAKTEPHYFQGIKKEWRIHAAQVEIYGEECGSDPLSVVNYAIDMKKQGPKNLGQGQFDQVWCVIDHDQHQKLSEAKDKAKANTINIALSVPCFELWYLLHFVYTTRSFRNYAELVKVLKSHLRKREYDKSRPPLDQLMPQLNQALINAKKLRKHNESTQSSNPSTQVDLLLHELIRLNPRLHKDRFPELFQ
ncbi:MAG TPA: RloB family protein [Candidatus Hydrogenedentes bacterium]|nr:RloB family protein [Candidatus Hydrogenedentota bacterium]